MYKIGFVCNDVDIINRFKQIEYFEGFHVYTKLDRINDLDVLIISDRYIDINEIVNDHSTLQDRAKHLFYMVSNERYTDNIKYILKLKDIVMIPPKKTTNQIVEFVCTNIFDDIKSDKNVITIFGADSKVGATQVSQCIAERIAEKTNLKVFLGFMSGNPGVDYLDINTTVNLDTIKIKLINNILRIQEFLDICTRYNNLYILQGTGSIIERRHYHPEHIESLINLISSYFDIIILDAGSNFELGMTIGAMNSTNFRYIVTTQQETALSNFARINDQILNRFDIKDFLIILNKYIDDPVLQSPINLAKQYNGTLAGILLYLPWGWQSEKEKKSLLRYNDIQFLEGLDSIIKLIAEQIGFAYDLEQKKTGNLLSKIKSIIG